jgi:signal transduction histidine kinase
MHAAPGSPLVRRAPPGASLAVVWWAAQRPPVPNLAGWASYWWVFLALAGVMTLSVGVLRRRPLSALSLLVAGSLAATLVPDPTRAVVLILPVLLVLPAGIEVCFIAATRPPRTSIAAAVIALAALVGYLAVKVPAELGWLATLVELAVGLTTVTAWLIGHSIRQAHLHAETVRAQAEAQAVTAERLRIARDLHDMVAHSIGIIAIQAGVGRRVIDTQPAEARNALDAIEATSRETLAGLRRMLGALRRAGPGLSAGLASLDSAPSLADLGALAAATVDAGVRVDVQWRGQRRPLPADIDLSAFRIIQEAVTNVVRHAGAGHCRVIIDQQDEELSVEVVDDGCGGAADGTGYGIAGMSERACLLGGQLTAAPRPGGGFRVEARLPVPPGAR